MATKIQANQTKGHSRSTLKIYFLLTTIAGVIWTLISLGFFIYAIGKKVIITNNEYIIGERYYELDNCKQNILKPVPVQQTATTTVPAMPVIADWSNNYVAPTEEEIAKCKAEKTTQLIQARNVLFKEDVLNGGIWTLLFLVLLMTHYPRFMRLNKKAE